MGELGGGVHRRSERCGPSSLVRRGAFAGGRTLALAGGTPENVAGHGSKLHRTDHPVGTPRSARERMSVAASRDGSPFRGSGHGRTRQPASRSVQRSATKPRPVARDQEFRSYEGTRTRDAHRALTGVEHVSAVSPVGPELNVIANRTPRPWPARSAAVSRSRNSETSRPARSGGGCARNRQHHSPLRSRSSDLDGATGEATVEGGSERRRARNVNDGVARHPQVSGEPPSR